MKDTSQSMTVRDLVLIGVLTVLSVIVSLVIGVATMPLMTFALLGSPAIGALATAPIYLLLAFKVGKRGVLLLFSVVRGLIFVFMGFPHMLIVVLPLGLIGELLMWTPGAYRSIGRNTIAWSIYNGVYSLHGAVLLWVFGSQYFSQEMSSMFSAEQLALMNVLYYTPTVIAATVAIGALGGAVGCWLGWKLVQKHFVRSGLVALS